MKICLLFKNLFNYDVVLPPPINTPSNIDTIYLTDNIITQTNALSKGWKYSYITEQFLYHISNIEKRQAIAYINCYPENVISEIKEYDYVFICDSNVLKMDTNYGEFTNNSSNKHALYVTSGYYKGNNNNILEELNRSLSNMRWSYDFQNIKDATFEYLQQFKDMNIDYNSVPVVSAKYIGWNIHHDNKNLVADYVYKEYCKHLQGNIIFSTCLVLYPELIFHYTDFLNDGCVNGHIKQY